MISEQVIQGAVRRLVAVAHPGRIILSGLCATGVTKRQFQDVDS